MTRRPTVSSSLVAALAIFLLSGCTSTADDADTAPTPSSTATLTQAAPTPTPTPVAAPHATCDSVLAAEGYQELADDGLEPMAASAVDPLAERMMEASCLSCSWGKPQTDITLSVAQVTVGPDAGAMWFDALAEDA